MPTVRLTFGTWMNATITGANNDRENDYPITDGESSCDSIFESDWIIEVMRKIRIGIT